MAIEIKMPQLSDTMNAGKILSWSKKVGDKVERGDILAEVETDKANLEIESFHNGTLLQIITEANNSAKVGEVIAYIGDPGEKVSAQKESDSKEESSPQKDSQQKADQKNEEQSPQAPHSHSNGSSHSFSSQSENHQRIKASPLAKKMAEERELDLSQVRGTGPEGRIVRRDVESATQKPQKSEVDRSAARSMTRSPQPEAECPQSRPSNGRTEELSKMRESIARRMQQTVVESPHFYTTTSVRMDDCLRMREQLKSKKEYDGLSFNHLILKACAYALSKEPTVNRAYREPNLCYWPENINLGIITAVEDGLMIPVLHAAEKLSLPDLVFESKALLERVRAGRPQSKDLSGATFSISNLGMFDVEQFTALISPGQGAVIAVGAIRDTPVVLDGQVIPAKVLKATLSVDHRVIDGVMAARFLQHFKECLECPALLMLPCEECA